MEHTRAVMNLDFNAKKTLFLSASKDGTAKVYCKAMIPVIFLRNFFFSLAVWNEELDSSENVWYWASSQCLFNCSKETWSKTFESGLCLELTIDIFFWKKIIVGGGQTAESVTTTRVDPTQFKVRFFHMIYEEEIGSIPGINFFFLFHQT